METCPVCHIGSMRERQVTYTQMHEGQLVVIQGVPALICDFCGERWFDTKTVNGLQRLLQPDSGASEGLRKGYRQFITWRGIG
jgi:YgiT-type zinc finger domain-containing protein